LGIVGPTRGFPHPKTWRFAESQHKKINKLMWAWQVWQWAEPRHYIRL